MILLLLIAGVTYGQTRIGSTSSPWNYKSGRLGFGTLNPGAKVTINGNASSDTMFVIRNSKTGSDSALVVLPNGYVGIGKANPAYALDVTGHFSATGSVLANNGGSVLGSTQIVCSYAGVLNMGNTNTAANAGLSLSSKNTEAVRIDPSQNVGIGTTVPATRLQVKGGNARVGVVTYTQIDSTRMYLSGHDTTGVGSTANVGTIKYYNGHFYGLIPGTPPLWKQLDN